MTVVQMLGAHPLIALQLSPQSKQTMGGKTVVKSEELEIKLNMYTLRVG